MDSISELLPKEARLKYKKAFEDRPYQFEVVRSVLSCLGRGSNAAVSMPSGLGKTLTAQIISVLWSKNHFGLASKILLVLPGRLSLNLYYEHISWAREFIKVVGNEPNGFNNAEQFSEVMKDAKVLITNPGRMIKMVLRNVVPYTKLQEFNLVIMDGYDEIIQPESGHNYVYNNQGNILLALLSSIGCRVLALCNSYLENIHWHSVINPSKIEVDPDLVRDFIPHVRINLRGVYDPNIHSMDVALRKNMAASVNVIKQAVLLRSNRTHTLRISQIVKQMRDIASGEKDKFYLYFRKQSPLILSVNQELQLAFQRVVRVIDLRLLLFEDLVTDLDIDQELSENDKLMRKQNARINLNGKVRTVKKLVNEIKEKRGLIFCRNLEICEYLAGVFLGSGKTVNLIHQKISLTECQERIKFFKRSKESILLATRYAGLRGLDIPEADYAIFYSPKDEEEVMWQEISRIRSTWKDPKEIYILYYKGTGEETKLNRLLWRMRGRESYIIPKPFLTHKPNEPTQDASVLINVNSSN